MDIRSGNDTNITGTMVIGDKVVATTTGDLNIESTQDSDNYTVKNQSVGISIYSRTNVRNYKDGKKVEKNTTG